MTRRGAVLAAAFAAIGLDRDEMPTAAPRPASREAMARLSGYFPNPVLQTHAGEAVYFYDDLLKGKVVVISLMYTGCGRLCPRSIANLLEAKEGLGARVGHDVFFYALTLDPALDTPAVLNAYARHLDTGPGFTFLTGAADDIYRIRRRLGLFDPDPAIDADRAQHGAVAAYGNEPLGRWGAVSSLARPERIVRAIRSVLPPETA
jgi:protein SCO1/2